MSRAALTQARLHELLAYDAQTGEFRWRDTSRAKRKSHKAGHFNKTNSYSNLQVEGRLYQAHRLAWFYVHGDWPAEIDHKNRNKSDNRIDNLRPSTRQSNCRNSSLRSDNASGVTGVYFKPKKNVWEAWICVDGKRIYLGCDPDKEKAGAIRKAANEKYGFSEQHGRPKPLIAELEKVQTP